MQENYPVLHICDICVTNWKNKLKQEIMQVFRSHRILPDLNDGFTVKYNVRCSEIKAWLGKRVDDLSDDALLSALQWLEHKGMKSDIMTLQTYLQEKENEMEERLFPDSIRTGLCQITINVSEEHFSYHDTFTWNIFHPDVTPEEFIETLCKDLNIPEEYEDLLLLEMNHEITQFQNIIKNKLLLLNQVNEPFVNSFDLVKQHFSVTDNYNSLNKTYCELEDTYKLYLFNTAEAKILDNIKRSPLSEL